jgi:regulator of protease activity HflC (stomatin/prohibitin superfamily)
MAFAGIVAACIVLAVLIIGVWMSIRIVPQSSAMVVQRLGKYRRTLETGFNMIVPILDKTLPLISLKEKVLDFDKVEVITKDNVSMQIDTIVFAQVVDTKLFTYGVENPMRAIDSLTATTLRNIIGELDLDETLTSRDVVNVKMRDIIDQATDPWGIKVRRVELKTISPPRTIQESMEKQMRAERERREAILIAEGQKKSAILVAEGEKESTLLRAEAKKLATIAEAEGQAQAIERILKAKPDAAYLTLQGFEAVKTMADGQATKIIVPSDLANVATLFTTIGETFGSGHEKPAVKKAIKK